MISEEEIEIVRRNHPLEVYLPNHGIQLHGGGDELTGKCPFHEEKENSRHKGHLSVSVSKQVYHCHHCEAAGDIFKFVRERDGLTFIQAYQRLGGRTYGPNGEKAPPPPPTNDIEAVYLYHDALGNPLFEVVRFKGKRFSQRKLDGTWNTAGITEKPLYHLPDVLRASTVWIVEGEKDVDTLTRMTDVVATTCPEGAEKWKTWHTEALTGKDIVICGDTDKKGLEHVAKIREAVADVCLSLKIISLPPPFKDISDFLAHKTSYDAIEDVARLELEAPCIGDDIQGRSIFDLCNLVLDPNDTVLGNRFLCRKSGMLFVGPSGMGKSSASAQQDILWCLGRVAFDIKPFKPLKIVTIQAEDDDGDIKEFASGVVKFLKLTVDDQRDYGKQCIYLNHRSSTGPNFLKFVERVLRYHRPDILRINPFQAYLGADMKNPEKTAAFLRTGLNPLLEKYNCAVIIVHHTPKTNFRDTEEWKSSDWMYAGAGAADITNWARAILAADPEDNSPVHKWIAAKRGKRIGWADNEGNATIFRYFSHSLTDGIHWEATAADQIPKAKETAKGAEVSKDDIMECMPLHPLEILRYDLAEEARKKTKAGINRCVKMVTSVIEDGLVLLIKKPRAGTKPAEYLRRLQ